MTGLESWISIEVQFLFWLWVQSKNYQTLLKLQENFLLAKVVIVANRILQPFSKLIEKMLEKVYS